MKFTTMLFDLDGTLVNTAPDLVAALNYVLSSHNQSQVEYSVAKQYVSKGSKALVRFGFGIEDTHPMGITYHQELLAYYEKHIADVSALFPGMNEVIERLDKWGIVTNKPEYLTHPLLEQLGLTPDVVVCGDTLSENKPSPLPIQHAMKQLGLEHTIMIGDDEVDYLSAKHTGIPSILVGWGYSKVTQWHYRVEDAQELLAWVK